MLTGTPPNADPQVRYPMNETARLLGINRNTLRTYMKKGLISGLSIHPNHTYFLGSEINRFWKESITA